jgi:hypothetical protein
VKLAVMTMSVAEAPTVAVVVADEAAEKVTFPDPVAVQPPNT